MCIQEKLRLGNMGLGRCHACIIIHIRRQSIKRAHHRRQKSSPSSASTKFSSSRQTSTRTRRHIANFTGPYLLLSSGGGGPRMISLDSILFDLSFVFAFDLIWIGVFLSWVYVDLIWSSLRIMYFKYDTHVKFSVQFVLYTGSSHVL